MAWELTRMRWAALVALSLVLLAGMILSPATAQAAPCDAPTENELLCNGPGGPILVIGSSSNSFSRYYAEILRAEGLNEFKVTDLSAVDAGTLASYDVAILGEAALSSAQAQMLSDWVTAGGNLIAMRPDAQLSGLLGLSSAGSPLSDDYIKVDTAVSPGKGIVAETMQFHGSADRYTATDATTVASLYSDATTPTSNPAVTLRSVGPNGGQAAAFTYDLARSIVYTRQGNPAWAGQSRDGQDGPIRSDNLFFGDAAGDPQPDWVDRDKVAIPQADEQQRLLANLIGEMNADRKPLPRFWYFPRSEEAVVVMTGDDHASGGTAGRFDQYKALSPAGCSVADWECVRGSSYVYVNSPLTNAQAAGYEADGFEVGLHHTTNCADFTPQSLAQGYADQLAQFAAKYTSVPSPSTNRTHCIAFSDWASQPKVESANGIRFDTNYYYWPPGWVDDTPGVFTGSAMPMRFADLDGSMIDAYQATTQMTDESGQSYPFTANALLDRAIGSEGYYGAYVANMHTDNVSSAGSDAIVSSAQARGVPVVSSRQMLEWLDGRNSSSFAGLAWNNDKLEFSIDVGAGANGLRAMVPTSSKAGALTGVKRNGSAIATTTQTIKGVEYAFIDAAPGSYEATYAVDDAGPVISNVAHAAGAGTATITWDTNEASDSRVDYGTNPASLTSSASNPALGTSHSIELTGLAPNTTYYYRVTSADAASNSTTDPGAVQAPRSFTTPAANLTDTTVADFSAGTTGADSYVSETDNGELTLKPAVGEEFSGALVLPTGWSSATWESQGGGAGGSATVSGGSLHVNGAFADTNTTFGPGRSLEFAATFGATAFQHAGYSDDFQSVWAMFSTNNTSNQLFARTNTGSAVVNTPIPGSLIGSKHRYRIEWAASEVRFFVDGSLVATHNASFGPAMSAVASDFTAGGPELALDWLRMSPYPASASFDSRVFDAGEQVNWQALSWTADTAANTGVALSVRTGNTPTPDASWSSFAPVAGSGGSIGGSSRYLQYRTVLNSSDPQLSPSLSEVSVNYGTGGDTTAPTITQRTPAPAATGVSRAADVEAAFSEPMNPATIDGASVRLRAQGAGSDVPASVSYAGNTATLNPSADLLPGTTYGVTVAGTVEDANGNPLGADDNWTFTTAGLSLIDTTSADFGAGTTGGDTYVSETVDGEVTLKPAEGAEFEGSSLPSGWTSAPWSAGGAATVTGGRLHVDGASAGTSATYGAGRSLEFVATFTGAPFQTAGFATDLNAPPWATFSTKGDSLFYARTHNGAVSTETPLPASLLGSAHSFRIEWDAGEVRFFVDDSPVATHTVSFADNMRPLTSDFNPGGPELALDWLRMSPYPATGSFDSRVFDAGESADWGALAWDSTAPAGTGVALSVRTGNTPTPDANWSAFTAIATSGGDIPGSSRYVQYRAALTTADASKTPSLSEVSIGYGPGAVDATPPTISQRTPAPDATAVAADANVAIQFSEAMNPATIDGSSVRLRKQGAGADVAASVSYAGTTATLDPNADLDPNAVYQVTVAGTVEDANGNALGTDEVWTFTTAPQAVGFSDTTTADFNQGATGADSYVSETDNGELTLKPAVGEEFSGGPGLPAGWQSVPWDAPGPGGSATVSGGDLVANGASAGTIQTYGSGRALEFTASFSGASFQHVGFGVDYNQQPFWAMFSVKSDGNFYARTNNGGELADIPLPSGLLGSPHIYRIEWDETEVRYFVDGAPVGTRATSFGSTEMRPLASDLFNGDAGNVSVDWLRMSPYPASASFDSQIFDAGQNADWGALTWDAATPAGTGLALSVRTGDTPTPDASWSTFAPIASSGDDIPGSSRYVQYRAELSSSDTSKTPVLSRVTVNGTPDNGTPDDDPVAVDDQKTVAENADASAIDVLANDTDADGGAKQIATATQPANGTVVVAADNLSLTYKPNAGYCNEPGAEPTDDFTYTLNGGSEATVAVTVDCADDVLDAPTITATAPASPANNNNPSVQGTVGGGSPTQVKVYASADCTGPTANVGTVAAFTGAGIPITVANNTTVPLSTRAVNAANDESPCSNTLSYVEDSLAPDTTITSGPPGVTSNASPSFTFTATQANSSFECRLDSTEATAWQPCSSPKSYANLASGAHTFQVRATDLAGNTDPTPAKRKFTVDIKPPNTTITSGPQGATNNPSPSFGFSSSSTNSSFECRLDSTEATAWQPCSSPKSYFNLASGAHTFEVRATDLAGNTDPTPAKRKFNVDTQPPNTTITSGPQGATTNASPSFAFKSSAVNSSFECRLDSTEANAWQPCSSPQSYVNLASGAHVFEVRATDLAGNTDPTPAMRSFTVSG